MKAIAIGLLLLMLVMTIYWSLTAPVMVPTLIIGWIMIGLQAKYECFN
ncbi:hypothetical protein ESCO47_00110 [Escherichia phage vB_EcoM_ESCO47]|nr:hypothetical protein ESCO47_00110 [Escherichia phage vB_EcoM_ESCO47]